jgi:hypothetical protein
MRVLRIVAALMTRSFPKMLFIKNIKIISLISNFYQHRLESLLPPDSLG